ncbi:hypothetical protein [Marinoscillum furvescens]|uniref:Uncharacterized protein n=1 Tax=Marinoscillum furvescens DSM 4134 TaxID=1122208 RepID=A0A3D9L8E4_MARFU|nr:hypothetical protein [Marinoscillum furvescens]REE02110.1 hypothetical protein C7460_102132 [Marinoscillum furvescens DSM 4134]
MDYQDAYLPVDPDFEDLIGKVKALNKPVKIHYFGPKDTIEVASGVLGTLTGKQDEYLNVDKMQVRLDKIITLAGRPGPAYDAYDSYANACLTCEDLGQF